MTKLLSVAILAAAVFGLAPRTASAQGTIDGFGGLSLNQLDTFQGSTAPLDFGGRVGVDLGRNVQLFGEAGRIGNLLPTTSQLLLSFTPVDVRVPAYYGEGGVRFLANSHAPISPYAEGSIGLARLGFRVDGVSPVVGTVSQLALSVMNRTEPMTSVGGGVMLHGGPVIVDLGYRYKQILGNSVIETLIGAGRPLNSHQVRFGIGVRF